MKVCRKSQVEFRVLWTRTLFNILPFVDVWVSEIAKVGHCLVLVCNQDFEEKVFLIMESAGMSGPLCARALPPTTL